MDFEAINFSVSCAERVGSLLATNCPSCAIHLPPHPPSPHPPLLKCPPCPHYAPTLDSLPPLWEMAKAKSFYVFTTAMNSCLHCTLFTLLTSAMKSIQFFFYDQYKYIHVILNMIVITTNHVKTILVFCLAFLAGRVSFSELCSVVASRARPLADRVSTDPREAPPSPRPPPPRTFSPKNPRQPRPYSAWTSACKFGSGQNWQKVGRQGWCQAGGGGGGAQIPAKEKPLGAEDGWRRGEREGLPTSHLPLSCTGEEPNCRLKLGILGLEFNNSITGCCQAYDKNNHDLKVRCWC